VNISIFGSGYVGLVTGICLAEMGNDVLCIDVDQAKVQSLQSGRIPIYEPGLQTMLDRNMEDGRLRFSDDLQSAVEFGQVLFIAVGTPPDEDGSADMRQVLSAGALIGRCMTDYKLIVNKSTVPVGTADAVSAVVKSALVERGLEIPYSVVSNPEFLKEGAAVDDFMRPDRIVVGVAASDERAKALMRLVYEPFQRNHDKLLFTDLWSAELIKYAANAMLATRISFMNELSQLAERIGADIEEVRRGIGLDPRIGHHFLYAGCGYGGSCFPKDVKALIKSAGDVGQGLRLLRAVEDINEAQKNVLTEKIVARFGEDLSGLVFALWGLAFKPGTDDMREATSQVVVRELTRRGARIVAYDPAAMKVAQGIFGDLPLLSYAGTPMEAVKDVDALVIVTEWKAFRSPDFAALKRHLRQGVIIDGRNIFDPRFVAEHGLEYLSIGRSAYKASCAS
jgi:UDPglucose 6-dehydrogenase